MHYNLGPLKMDTNLQRNYKYMSHINSVNPNPSLFCIIQQDSQCDY